MGKDHSQPENSRTEVAEQEDAQQPQVDTELPADKGKPLEELEDEDHRDEPTEMQDGGE